MVRELLAVFVFYISFFNYLLFEIASVDPTIRASYHDYYGPEFISFGKPGLSATSALSKDEVLQGQFWEESVRLTKDSFHNL
jgi:hypothetical protein